MVMRRHDLDVTRERARETAFELAKEIAKKSAHGAREMDRFIRPQFGHERKRMAEWDENHASVGNRRIVRQYFLYRRNER